MVFGVLMSDLGDLPEELLGERLDVDPFDDDEVFECAVDGYEVCDSCQ